MFPIPSLLTVAKYGFISMVVTSAGFLIGNVVVVKHHMGEPLDDLVYKPRTSRHLEDTVTGLDKECSKCFTHPTKTFCLGHANEPFRIAEHQGQLEREDDIDASSGRHPIHSLMSEFSAEMMTLGVRAVLLEPSMLFCAISPTNKYHLLVRDFNPHLFQGALQTVTVGLFEEDAKTLEEAIWVDSQNRTSSSSFEAFRTRRWLIDAESGEQTLYSVHFLFARGPLQVHAVVLFVRNAYLWHAGTDLPSRGLLFTEEGTYENFTSIPMTIKDMQLYLPSSPVQFLSQIPNSQFLNCQPPADGVHIFTHPTLTEDQLINRAVVAIQELKTVFQPHFVNFWLWAESLNGWFKTCNIFEETYEMSIAVSYSSVKRLNLTAILANSIYLDVLETYQLDGRAVGATLDCYGLQINIYICHEGRESVWYSHKTERDVETKRVIPFKFRLCSSDVLGQRIYVPCEAGQIIQLQPELNSTNESELY